MTAYTDTLGRTWLVRLDVAALRRVRAVAGLDLLAGRDDAAAAVSADPLALADALYAACLPQADARGVDRGGFGAGLSGRAIERATEALVTAVADSLPTADDFAGMPMDRGGGGRARDPWAVLDELAFAAGLDPAPFTQRELVRAFRARMQADWDRTAFAVASAANLSPHRRGRPATPAELNPYRSAAGARPSGTMTGAELGRFLVAAGGRLATKGPQHVQVS